MSRVHHVLCIIYTQYLGADCAVYTRRSPKDPRSNAYDCFPQKAPAVRPCRSRLATPIFSRLRAGRPSEKLIRSPLAFVPIHLGSAWRYCPTLSPLSDGRSAVRARILHIFRLEVADDVHQCLTRFSAALMCQCHSLHHCIIIAPAVGEHCVQRQ